MSLSDTDVIQLVQLLLQNQNVMNITVNTDNSNVVIVAKFNVILEGLD